MWQTRTVPLMGTTVTLVGGAADRDPADVRTRLDETVAELGRLAAAWTRFDPSSALERLNDAPGDRVAVDPALGRAIAVALAVRARSHGFVDPAVGPALSAAGYDRTIGDLDRVPPAEVAACAAVRPASPARAPDRPASIAVAADRRSVRRPAGVRLDLGGTAKGLAADLAAARLRDLDRYAVDVGGDVRVGGRRRDVEQTVHVAHPLPEGGVLATLKVGRGAVATSTIARRAWRCPDGRIAHHLLDPSTGRPAWTGVLQATARARTAVEAELLAKVALLRGPRAGAEVLRARHGGVLVLADGRIVEVPA